MRVTSKCKSALHILQLDAVPIFEQLRIEEALLRADHQNWLILNRRVPPAIVLGISGRLDSMVNRSLMEKDPFPMVRRFSGGGTVFVDEHTLFTTFICNHNCTGVAPFPEKIHRWAEEIYQEVFKKPDFALKENDYVFGDRKFGGNAQYLQKNRWLHHTSFLWDFDAERMQYLLHPPKKPKYRQERPHVDFLCCLKHYLSSPEEMHQRLIETLQKQFQLRPMRLEEVIPIREVPHRKATILVSF